MLEKKTSFQCQFGHHTSVTLGDEIEPRSTQSGDSLNCAGPFEALDMYEVTGASGRGSSVGIATGYRLDGPEFESRWGARFSAPVQTDPGADTASCTMGTGSFPGVKSGRGVTLTPHPLLVPWS
jgi:hypothetical protein